jgi:hypothetical protein
MRLDIDKTDRNLLFRFRGRCGTRHVLGLVCFIANAGSAFQKGFLGTTSRFADLIGLLGTCSILYFRRPV